MSSHKGEITLKICNAQNSYVLYRHPMFGWGIWTIASISIEHNRAVINAEGHENGESTQTSAPLHKLFVPYFSYTVNEQTYPISGRDAGGYEDVPYTRVIDRGDWRELINRRLLDINIRVSCIVNQRGNARLEKLHGATIFVHGMEYSALDIERLVLTAKANDLMLSRFPALKTGEDMFSESEVTSMIVNYLSTSKSEIPSGNSAKIAEFVVDQWKKKFGHSNPSAPYFIHMDRAVSDDINV